MYLIHWPNFTPKDKWKELNAETWRAMEDLQKQGLVKNIVVPNFAIHHLEELLKTANVKPAVNQLELSPIWQQRETVEFCKKHNIQCEAYSPFASGLVFEKNLINNIAKSHNKTCGQIVLRWSIQKGFIPLPRTTSVDEMRQNLEIFDFELSEEDISSLDTLNSNPACAEPDTLTFILDIQEKLINPVKKVKEKVSLLGFIPFLKTRYFDNKREYYLFNLLPFILRKNIRENLDGLYCILI